MTKERRLAVQMWQEIAEAIEKNKERCSVQDYKRIFCQKHNLKWQNDCYLCHYFREQCKKCPIFLKANLDAVKNILCIIGFLVAILFSLCNRLWTLQM